MAARDAALLAAVLALMLALPIVAPRELIVEPTLDLLRSTLHAARSSLLLLALLLIVVVLLWIGDSWLRRTEEGRSERGIGALIVVIALALLAAPAARIIIGGSEADDVPEQPIPIRRRPPTRSSAWYEGQGVINTIALVAVLGLIVYVSADVRRAMSGRA